MTDMRPEADERGLSDEIEQLRTALEGALEENAALLNDRDRLRDRLRQLSCELQVTQAAMTRQQELAHAPDAVTLSRQSQTEEELRVAFEELQVLTEELEVANTSLLRTNEELDARVDERTRQLQHINSTLQSTEASLRAVADVVPDLIWRTDSVGQADWFNERWLAFTGKQPGDAAGMGWLNAVHPVDQAVTRTTWAVAIGSGQPYQHEFRLRDAHGNFRWFLVRAQPLHDDSGRTTRWFVAATEIHDQRLAMESLQQSENRFRTLVEGMPQLVWRALDGGQWTWSSPQWSLYTGQEPEDAIALGWLEMFHPDDRAAARAAWQQCQEIGSLDLEGRIYHASEKRHRHFRTRALPVRDEAGRIVEWLGTSTDVDDILQLQEQQSVLVAELQHRTRNLMGVVQSLTARTIRDASSLDQFEDNIRHRLAALARVQSLLSRREGAARIAFDVLITEELSALGALSGESAAKVSLNGPQGISLRSATVQTFALALHELATNAAKYGALSQPGGHLRVGWWVEPAEGDGRRLCVDWRETGVTGIPDANVQAQGGGYGRELIERALPYQLNASTSYRIEPEGVHCTIQVTIPAP